MKRNRLNYQDSKSEVSLQNLASASLCLSSPTSRAALAILAIPTLLLYANGSIDSQLKYLVNALHLLATTFNISCTHALSNRLPLLWRYRCQSLSFQKLDASALRTEVRLEAD